MKVGIIGYGWIGKATQKLFPDAQVYDKYIEGYTKPLENCDIAFLAVPTPWNQGDGLDCSAVEDAIATCGADFIVIRSATQPGFADEMVKKYKKKIVVQPEYLGETPNHPFWIECIRNIEKAKGHLIGKTKSETQNFRIVRRSIVAIKDIKLGEKFTTNNIGCKRPMLGIPAERWHKVLNKKSKKSYKKNQFI